MAAVAAALARTVLAGPLPIPEAAAAFILLARWRINSVWLIAAGALAGWTLAWVHGDRWICIRSTS